MHLLTIAIMCSIFCPTSTASCSWAYLIADEAHRLKNSEGALHREMRQLEAANTLLVTGTPLQNNLRELWAILNFLEPEKFSHCEDFEERHRYVAMRFHSCGNYLFELHSCF